MTVKDILTTLYKAPDDTEILVYDSNTDSYFPMNTISLVDSGNDVCLTFDSFEDGVDKIAEYGIRGMHGATVLYTEI